MLDEQILPLFSKRLREVIRGNCKSFDNLQEIRIRLNQPVILSCNNEERILGEQFLVSERDIRDIVETACGYSGYAFEEEISKGYITIQGGHRIGIAGRGVMTAQGVQTIKHISALNIRIAHPFTGCAEKWRNFFYKENRPCHVLIISPPGCGKTTLLRDAVRILSDGCKEIDGVTVGVVDERSEIAGTYRGAATHNLGIRTDVLDGCPKSLGMEMLLRSMSPKVLAVDEIGASDVGAIENALRCGCKVLATLHGECIQDFFGKPGFASLVREKVFERYIFLESGQTPGNVKVIYGQNFEILWEENACT